MENTNEPKYLNKSRITFRLYGGLFLFAILTSTVLRPLLKVKSYWANDAFDLIVGGPILVAMVLPPLGLYYTWKSSRLKEGFSLIRFRYFIAHAIFCLLLMGMISIFIRDMSKLI